MVGNMKLIRNKRRMLILYGSETGTSQDLAEFIWRESKKYGFVGPVLAMDDYNVRQLIEEKFVIFVCATTGQGEEPLNMKTFWKFLLRKSLAADSLAGMHFGVLGLGDSSYVKFNFVAKRLNKRLLQLSATSIMPLGLCDDQHDLGPSAVYLKWISELWEKLNQISPCSPFPNVDVQNWQYRWNVEAVNAESSTDKASLKWLLKENPLSIELLKNERTTDATHFQDVRLLSFKAINEIDWKPGDVLVVKPSNAEKQIVKLFELFAEHNLGFNEDTVVRVSSIDPEMPTPKCFEELRTLRQIAEHVWDLNAIPRQRVFELLAFNCKNDLEKQKLIEFTTPEGLEDMFNYTSRPRRNILELLFDFPHASSALTIPVLFELFPSIKPRLFSIASSRKSELLEILVAVVEYKLTLSEPRKGLCSNWLKNLEKGSIIPACIKKGTLKIPGDLSTPIIMVGPGTGIAPFRSLLMDKWLAGKTPKCINILFFGCRNQLKDFHCKNDLMKMMEEGIVKCYFAFSRDQDHKIYVQHKIVEQKDELRTLITDKHAVILVAGNSKNMPQAVKEAFCNLLADDDLVEKMKQDGRYQEETWS